LPALGVDHLPAAAAPPGAPLTPVSAAAAPAAGVQKIPDELLQQLIELERWAVANRDDAKRDAIAFWSLKVPAILASAGAGVMAHFDLSTTSVIAGAIASACILVDGVHPRGTLRNLHLRAHHDIRILASNMVVQWRSRDAVTDEQEVARRIIRDAEKERRRIAGYVRDAETALGNKAE
jgi:hypothetical protein